MEFRQITPGFAVAPQIGPEDVPAVSEAGYAAIICNRPDDEVPQDLSSYAIAKAAAEAGLTFSYLPVANGPGIAKTVENLAAALSVARGPVLAYCKSGMRSAAVWALWRAGMDDPDAILAQTSRAGYELDGLRGRLVHLAERKSR